jgi:hypothetical protein
MMLEFLNTLPQYDPYSDSVCFFAADAEDVVVFHISRAALEQLENSSIIDDRDLLPTFYRHLSLIRKVAADWYRVHRSGQGNLSCTLTIRDFE